MGRFLLLRIVGLCFMMLALVVFGFTVYIYLTIDLNAAQFIQVAGIDESWRSLSTLIAMRELVAGVISSISLFAVGLLINLMISIEANTKETALLLQQIAGRRAAQRKPDLAPVAPKWDELPDPIPLAEMAKKEERRRRAGTIENKSVFDFLMCR